tara:strand:+ start:757 stop:1305 length:549 start_codon:yes stop_codon:yes gene_type:complete
MPKKNSKNLTKYNSKFPNSLVPEAKTLDDVFEAWKDAGLTPTEVSEKDLIQRIIITSEKHNSKLNWSVEKHDGVSALATMALTLKHMVNKYLKGEARPYLAKGSRDTKILIELKDNEIKIAYNHNQAMTVKGVLTACLWKMINELEERTEEHPLDIFKGSLLFHVDKAEDFKWRDDEENNKK